MSKIKSLILGSAAIVAASAGAQAADLPVKAKAVQYVKICSLYGAGFYYIPGTDTCIKLGGYVQMDVNLNGQNYDKPAWDQVRNMGTGSRDRDYYSTRARNQFNIDTRTATEYGVVRTFWASNFEFSTGFGPSSGNLTVDYGFIQFAGFTFGKAVSGFQTPWGAYGANNNTSFLLGGYDNATGITQIAYTWQFGNGVSAQLGVEDNAQINRAQLINGAINTQNSASFNASSGVGSTGTAGGLTGALNGNQLGLLSTSNATAAGILFQGVYANYYGGNWSPDVTANIRVDQSAFTFQVSGAMHLVNATYSGAVVTGANNNGSNGVSSLSLTELNGHPDVKVGGAVSVGLQLKNLPTGPGDKLSLDGTWSQGATKYVISGVTGNNFDIFGAPSNVGSYQSLAVAALADAVFNGGGTSLELTTAWGFRGAYVHNWSPTWETSVFGSYSKVDYNTNASNAICFAQANARAGLVSTTGTTTGGTSNGFSCNPDFAIWQIGTRTAWTPVKNLTFSGELMYTGLDQNNTGSITVPQIGLAGAFKPVGTYDYKDQGVFSGNLRVRRTW